VTYDYKRGEPRGARSKRVDHHAQGLGDCVDCSICVQVCPTGIDIRQGLQYMCIGCGACIDACNQVMQKLDYPQGLIRYTSEHGILQNLDAKAVMARLFRPRILVYSALMVLIVSVFFGALATRETLRVDVIRDRGMLGREVAGGLAENVYRFQFINASETPLTLSVQAQGESAMTVLVGGGGRDDAHHIEVPAASNLVLPVVVHAHIDGSSPGAYPITFVTTSTSPDGEVLTEVREASSFIFPK